VKHLLVTNDFPPKLGGIQSYLWELWRRLDPTDVCVLTTPHEGAAEWDRQQAFRVERTRDPVLLPHPLLARHINRLAADHGAELVILDPVLPIGMLGPFLRSPYGLVAHGAEITVPGRLVGSSALMGRLLRGAQLVIAAGGYPLAEAERCAGRRLPSVVVPPGVDVERFDPVSLERRAELRAEFGLPVDGLVVMGVSRLVPRKGFDRVIEAVAKLRAEFPTLHVGIAGGGRDRRRLERIAERCGTPVTFLGRVPDERLADAYRCGDVFAMACRSRWAGLEQEGFGIVFLEAAAAGVPQLGGRSGGSHEAVADGCTGVVVDHPDTAAAVAAGLRTLLTDPQLRRDMAVAGRDRAVAEFSYDVLAARLGAAIDAVGPRSKP
jgi:phosphatidylinositol alpha-1,6-mannosyltransferase